VAQTDASPSSPSLARVLGVVLIAGVVVQAAFVAMAVRATGRVDGFALRSVDGQEFMCLAQNLAQHGIFSQDDKSPFHPDTWRCPGYPLLLAGCVRLLGNGTIGPILVQQGLAVLSVGLLVSIASRWMSTRRAGVVGALWLLDPYRGYYALWILSVTWFVALLLLAVWIWQRGWKGTRSPWLAGALGAVVGLAVLTRPIGMVLVPVVVLGTLAGGGGTRHRLGRTLACLVGLSLLLGPWLIRNRLVAGRFALSHQTGTVLTYYKAAEIVLWAEDRANERYDEDAVHDVWDRFDQRLRERWSAQHGPLTPEARRDIAWPQVAWGRVRAVDPLLLDRQTLRVGLTVLAEHPVATASCWLWRCGSILTFPLGLAIWPPDAADALPFAGMLPNLSITSRRGLAALLAAPFVVLAIVAGCRAIVSIRSDRFAHVLACALPLLALLLATSPQLDPRFRVPMIPFLLLMAAIRGPRRLCRSKYL